MALWTINEWWFSCSKLAYGMTCGYDDLLKHHSQIQVSVGEAKLPLTVCA